MAGDDLKRIEAVFGAVAKITSGDEGAALLDARCPKCKASDFAHFPDLYTDALVRLEEHPDQADVAREGGVTDAQIVAKFAPPQRRSPTLAVLATAIPLGGVAYFAYRQFGDNAGLFTGMAAGVLSIVVLLTSMRRLSDEYYARRRQWRSRYMCRKCGQLVEA